MRTGLRIRAVHAGLVCAVAGSLATPALADEPKQPPPRGPVRVFVVAGQGINVSKDELHQLNVKANALSAEVGTLRKELEAQHGKDQGKWPADKLEAFNRKIDASNTLGSDWLCGNTKPKDVEDTAKEMSETFGKAAEKGWVAAAASRDEADLVVEVLGRNGPPGFMGGAKRVCFKLSTGGSLPADALSKIPRAWKSEFDPSEMFVDHFYWPEEPFLRVIVVHNQRWRDAERRGAKAVQAMVYDHYDALKPAK